MSCYEQRGMRSTRVMTAQAAAVMPSSAITTTNWGARDDVKWREQPLPRHGVRHEIDISCEVNRNRAARTSPIATIAARSRSAPRTRSGARGTIDPYDGRPLHDGETITAR
jgi:hypothetical protein